MDEINMLERWDIGWMTFPAYDGHTRAMVVPRISGKKADLVFASDLIPLRLMMEPGSFSSYDIQPERQVDEKEAFLKSITRPTLVVLYHDPLEQVMLLNGGDLSPEQALQDFSQFS